MEELKANNIIENLESIAAEKGADALTGEIIEECCRTNDADPEDFKSFICERIDIQELKKLSSESLDQVAGGARPVKQGMASFLAATSLLGSAANFTVSAGNDAPANAKRDIHKAQLIDLQKSVEYKNRRNKKKQSAWTGWDTLKYMGLGSFATCALAIAYWAHSQKNSSSDDPSAYTSEVGYSKYEYSPVEVYWRKLTQEGIKQNRERLEENVDSGIERFKRLSPKYKDLTYRYDASKFFGAKRTSKHITPQKTEAAKYVGPRRGCKGCYRKGKCDFIDSGGEKLPKEVEFVYDLPDGYCTVYDYGKGLVKVTDDDSKRLPARLWWVERFSLPALFAVDAALRQQGQPGLNPEATVVQNAGNAVSPGGDILAGNGSQEESLMMDTDAYLLLNSKHAYEQYYLKNEEEIAKKREAKKEEIKEKGDYSTAAVKDWNGTGIFGRAIYSKGVGLRGAKNGETINMITTAAADYNSKHNGTYMGPIEVDGDLLPYVIQSIYYWVNILFTAYICHNKCIVLTLGGGGAYEGDPNIIIYTLFIALSQFGPHKNCCFARCFDEIIIALKGKEGKKYHERKKSTDESVINKEINVNGLLYTPYKEKFGPDKVRHIEAQTGN